MKKNQNKPTWEQLQQNEKVYMPKERFSKAYNTTMRYVICKTNLQTAMFYYVLYSHYNSLDDSCFPDLDTLAFECGVSVKTIQNMIKALKDEKIIEYRQGKQGRCNSYKFPLEPKNTKKKSYNSYNSNSSSKKKFDSLLDDDFDEF